MQRAVLIVDTGATTTLIRSLVLTRLGLTVPATATIDKQTRRMTLEPVAR